MTGSDGRQDGEGRDWTAWRGMGQEGERQKGVESDGTGHRERERERETGRGGEGWDGVERWDVVERDGTA